MPVGGFFGSPDSLERQANTSLTGASPGSPSQNRWGGGGGPTTMSQGRGGPGGLPYPDSVVNGGGGSARQQYPMLYGINSQGQVGVPTPPPTLQSNPLGGVQSLVDTMYGPQSEILAAQFARQKAMMDDPLYGPAAQATHTSDALRRDNALANQALGLDRQALGLERGLAQGQLGNLSRLRDILGQQRGLVGERKGLDTAQAKDAASRQQWDLESDLTARGAFNTVANERGTGRINRDLDYNLRGIDQTARNNLLGLTEKGIGYDNQAAALNNKLANIGLDSQRLGISSQQLQNALADGLYNSGLSGLINVSQLADAMTGTNVQQAQLMGTVLQQVMAYSGMFTPEQIAMLNRQLGIGPGSGQTSRSTTGMLPGSRVPR